MQDCESQLQHLSLQIFLKNITSTSEEMYLSATVSLFFSLYLNIAHTQNGGRTLDCFEKMLSSLTTVFLKPCLANLRRKSFDKVSHFLKKNIKR